MSAKDNNKARILRTSSGTTRLSASNPENNSASVEPAAESAAESTGNAAESSNNADERSENTGEPQLNGASRDDAAENTDSGSNTSADESVGSADATHVSQAGQVPHGGGHGTNSSVEDSTESAAGSDSDARGVSATSETRVLSVAAGGTRIGGFGTSEDSTEKEDSLRRSDPPRVKPAKAQVYTAVSASPSSRDAKTPPHVHPTSTRNGADSSTDRGIHPGGKKTTGPRTVKLSVKKLDPWSVMKMSFLLSVAIGIATVIAVLVVWLILQSTGVINNVEETVSQVAGKEGAARLLSLFELGKVMSAAVVMALANVILLVALSTIFAFLYNLGATLAGGFYLTLTDE